jgi:hypothetical protein
MSGLASPKAGHSVGVAHRYSLVEQFSQKPITLIPIQQEVSIETITNLRQFPGQQIAVCDFRVEGMEREGVRKPYGYYLPQPDIHVIDHHGRDDERMERWISSSNLANLFLREYGPFSGGQLVVAHHFDCDSIITSQKVRGILPCEQRFDDAVIAADHSGAPHPVADLLTALESAQRAAPPIQRYLFSLRNLELLLNHESLEPEAARLVRQLEGRRELARRIVQDGKLNQSGDLFWGMFQTQMDPELLIPHLPTAKLIVTMYPMSFGETEPSLAVRLVLGQAAPLGFTLPQLDINSLDPHYGGRWNRGSNRRGGGTTISPEQYVKTLTEKLSQALAAMA